MTREETRAAIAVMQHYADGGEVEVCMGNDTWISMCEPAQWDRRAFEYRIKPFLWDWIGLRYRIKATPHEVWVNETASGRREYHASKEAADRYAPADRVGEAILFREVR